MISSAASLIASRSDSHRCCRCQAIWVPAFSDEVFARVQERRITIWPHPWRGNEGHINHNDGGRGFYFEDPSGHYLEVLTSPYGRGAEDAS